MRASILHIISAWRSVPYQNIVISMFISLIFVQIFSNLSTVLYPHLWWSFYWGPSSDVTFINMGCWMLMLQFKSVIQRSRRMILHFWGTNWIWTEFKNNHCIEPPPHTKKWKGKSNISCCCSFLPQCSDVVKCVAGLLLSMLLLLALSLLQENRVGWADSAHCRILIQCNADTHAGCRPKPHWDRNSRRTALQ